VLLRWFRKELSGTNADRNYDLQFERQAELDAARDDDEGTTPPPGEADGGDRSLPSDRDGG